MSAQDRPNIIYILGDDHRAELLSCAGHPVLETPHLDKLAAEGTRFANAFCTSPLCTPSRTCHYLGQWERKHGINFNSGTAVSPAAWQRSFPMLLKQAGYYTGWVGKNHVPVGEDGYSSGHMEAVFDYWYGNHGHSTFYPKELPGDKGRIYENAALDTQPEIFAEGVRNFLRPDPRFTDSCQPALPQRDESRPFCLCVTFNLPHGASTSTMQLRPEDDEIYRSLYRDRFQEIPLPDSYGPWNQAKIPRHVWNGIWIPSYDWVKSPTTCRERILRQCQTITGVDRFLGQLRTWLIEESLADNTIIVFSTDHGIHFGEHGIGGKSLLYEEDLHIPTIIYDPRLPEGRARGQVRDELVVVEDLAPTVLSLCGEEVPEGMQGQSLVELLRGEAVDWRDEFFVENLFDHQNYPRCEGVRSREWKYIRYFKRQEDPAQEGKHIRGTLDYYADTRLASLRGEAPIYEELYHLAEDPNELHNLADDPSHGDQLARWRQRCQALGEEALAGVEQTDTVTTQSQWARKRS